MTGISARAMAIGREERLALVARDVISEATASLHESERTLLDAAQLVRANSGGTHLRRSIDDPHALTLRLIDAQTQAATGAAALTPISQHNGLRAALTEAHQTQLIQDLDQVAHAASTFTNKIGDLRRHAATLTDASLGGGEQTIRTRRRAGANTGLAEEHALKAVTATTSLRTKRGDQAARSALESLLGTPQKRVKRAWTSWLDPFSARRVVKVADDSPLSALAETGRTLRIRAEAISADLDRHLTDVHTVSNRELREVRNAAVVEAEQLTRQRIAELFANAE